MHACMHMSRRLAWPFRAWAALCDDVQRHRALQRDAAYAPACAREQLHALLVVRERRRLSHAFWHWQVRSRGPLPISNTTVNY